MCKNKSVCFFFCLTLCVMSSCVSQKLCFVPKCHNAQIADNSLFLNNETLFKADLWTIDLTTKKLLFCSDSISSQKLNYLEDVLRDCNSHNDTIIAFSNDFMILKSSIRDNKSNAHYLYSYDIDSNKWVCQYNSNIDIGIKSLSDTFFFQREVYMTKKRNRVIIKDYFDTFSILYVIQGVDSATDFYTTKAWNPVEFSSFITTSNYIIDRINPISYNIAKSVFLLKGNKCYE
ncbi:hypothetical protein QYZ87_09885 [Porphyromonadaceae bacterium W3.11]|nr:hypothetical protein [Porphyromonadaceae bacterium W3.11]